LVPLVSGDATPPLEFRSIQAIDISGGLAEHVELREAIAKAISLKLGTALTEAINRAPSVNHLPQVTFCERSGAFPGAHASCVNVLGHLWRRDKNAFCERCAMLPGKRADCTDVLGHRWRSNDNLFCERCGMFPGQQASCLNVLGHRWISDDDLFCE